MHGHVDLLILACAAAQQNGRSAVRKLHMLLQYPCYAHGDAMVSCHRYADGCAPPQFLLVQYAACRLDPSTLRKMQHETRLRVTS